MEESRDNALAPETDGPPQGDPASDPPVALKKQWILIAVGGLALVAGLVVGAVALKAANSHQQNVEAQEERRVVRDAIKDAEVIVVMKEAKRAHQAILDASPATPVAPTPDPEEKPAEAPVAASLDQASPAPVAVALAPTLAVSTRSPRLLARKADSQAVRLPATSGNCLLTGGTGESGQALSRCLEEFNRLDGRSP